MVAAFVHKNHSSREQPSRRTGPRARRPDPAPARTAAIAARPYRRDDAKPDHGEESYKGCDKLKGCAAIITGGDSGSGRAVAIAFAREGADVLISYLPEEEDDARETVRWVEQAGRRVVLVADDIADRQNCTSIVERAVSAFGKLDNRSGSASPWDRCS
jgi:short chain dehydrogenase